MLKNNKKYLVTKVSLFKINRWTVDDKKKQQYIYVSFNIGSKVVFAMYAKI